MNTHDNTKSAVQRVCEYVATHPASTRGKIVSAIGGGESVSTFYRWLEIGIAQGMLVRQGTTSGATYSPSDDLRKVMLRKHLAKDARQRGKVGYNADFLERYIPNVSYYLKPYDLKRLQARCPPGTAPLSLLDSNELGKFLCDLSYASSHLEGNGYNYADTIHLAQMQIEMLGGSERDKVMILNHYDAAKYLIRCIKDPDFRQVAMSTTTMRSVHALLAHELIRDTSQVGALRKRHVEIYDSSYIPLDNPDSIANYFERMIVKAGQIENPFEQSFFLLVHLPYLQPFADCNKRVARVACNIPLLMAGITPISWIDVTTRKREYMDANVAIYEQNDPILLSDLFVESFMHSAERFRMLQEHKNPDPIAAKYRRQIKICIRAQVLEQTEMLPPDVDIADIPEFQDYIKAELLALSQNDVLGVRYELPTHVVQAWHERENPVPTASQSQMVA